MKDDEEEENDMHFVKHMPMPQEAPKTPKTAQKPVIQRKSPMDIVKGPVDLLKGLANRFTRSTTKNSKDAYNILFDMIMDEIEENEDRFGVVKDKVAYDNGKIIVGSNIQKSLQHYLNEKLGAEIEGFMPPGTNVLKERLNADEPLQYAIDRVIANQRGGSWKNALKRVNTIPRNQKTSKKRQKQEEILYKRLNSLKRQTFSKKWLKNSKNFSKSSTLKGGSRHITKYKKPKLKIDKRKKKNHFQVELWKKPFYSYLTDL